MEIEIKCLECGKRTRRFEIGPAAYNVESISDEILLKDRIICPKCKKDISDGKCVAQRGEFMISLMAITIGLIANKEDSFELPNHLRRFAPANNEQYNKLKEQSHARIRLVDKF